MHGSLPGRVPFSTLTHRRTPVGGRTLRRRSNFLPQPASCRSRVTLMPQSDSEIVATVWVDPELVVLHLDLDGAGRLTSVHFERWCDLGPSGMRRSVAPLVSNATSMGSPFRVVSASAAASALRASHHSSKPRITSANGLAG